MKIYLAPLEGNTGYIYRRAVRECFGGFDKYFIPFITPNQHGKMSTKEIKDILPEHNAGMYAVPQIMTKYAEEFILTARILQEEYGYSEVNLNLGCPSKTVVTKGRGAGFLAHPEELQEFLDRIFAVCPVKISIKTRLGLNEPEEFEELLELYNRYPMEELIIHPRVQREFYNGLPNLEAFEKGFARSNNPVCYNGNIFSAADYKAICGQFPSLNCIMIGRGVMTNPALARELRGGKVLEKEELQRFHDTLYAAYSGELSGERNILFRMKELWSYLSALFADSPKCIKKIKKSQTCAAYESAVRELFANAEIRQ